MEYCGDFIRAFKKTKESIFSKYLNTKVTVSESLSSIPAPSPNNDQFSQYMKKITKNNFDLFNSDYLEYGLDEIEYYDYYEYYYDEDGNDDMSLDMDDPDEDFINENKNSINQKTSHTTNDNLNIIASSISKEEDNLNKDDNEYDIEDEFELEYDFTEDDIYNDIDNENSKIMQINEANDSNDIEEEAPSPKIENEKLNEEDIYDNLDVYDTLYYDEDTDDYNNNELSDDTAASPDTNDISNSFKTMNLEQDGDNLTPEQSTTENEDIYDFVSDLELYFDEDTLEKLESNVKSEIDQMSIASISSPLESESPSSTTAAAVKNTLNWSDRQFKKEVKAYLSVEIVKIINESDMEDTMDFDESILYEFDIDTFYKDIKDDAFNLEEELTFLNENLSILFDRDIDLEEILDAIYNNELDDIYWISEYMSSSSSDSNLSNIDENDITPSEADDITPNINTLEISNKRRKMLSYNLNEIELVNKGN